MPIELTREEIAQIVQDHSDATTAVEAGSSCWVHAAHGYLVNTFLSPATNKRTDEYGGSFENRLRFPREVIAAMRAQLGPKRLLCARLNGDDLLPGGLKIDEYCKVGPALVEAGLDLIHVSAGTYQVMEKRIPPMYLVGETFAGYANPIRQASRVPIIASGTIHDPAEANRLIADDEADFVFLARPLFADPALPNKLRRTDRVTCCRAFDAIRASHASRQAGVAIAQSIRRPGGNSGPVTPASSVKTIAVIGAGPAGINRLCPHPARAPGHPVGTREQDRRPGAACLSARSSTPCRGSSTYYETALGTRRCRRSLRRECAGRDQSTRIIIVHAVGPTWDGSSPYPGG